MASSTDPPSPPWKRELLAKRRARSNAPEDNKTVSGPTTRERSSGERVPSIMLAGRSEARPVSSSPAGRWTCHAPGHSLANKPGHLTTHSAATNNRSGSSHSPARVSGGALHASPSPTKPSPGLNHSSDVNNMVEDKRSREPLIHIQPQKQVLSPTLATLAHYNEIGTGGGEEELAYGPGIVKKLKSRFLSRTLREKSAESSARPSLRRAASLEDWLDLDKDTVVTSQPSVPSRSTVTTTTTATTASSTVTPVQPATKKPPALTLAPQNDSNYLLKKTRSVDNLGGLTRRSVSVSDLLSPTHRAPRPTSLIKEDIVIIERSTEPPTVAQPDSPKTVTTTTTTANKPRSRVPPSNAIYAVEHDELPAPDTVKQVKRLFEPGSTRRATNRRPPSATSAAPAVATGSGQSKPVATITTTSYKLSVARMNEANENQSKPKPKKVPAETPKITDLAPSPLPVVTSPKPAPLTPKPNLVRPTRPVAVAVPAQPEPPSVQPAADPLPDCVDGEEGFRRVTPTAMDNIRKESVSTQFNFSKPAPQLESNKLVSQNMTTTTIMSNQSANPPKQVGIIRPITFQPPAKETHSTPVVTLKTEPVVSHHNKATVAAPAPPASVTTIITTATTTTAAAATAVPVAAGKTKVVEERKTESSQPLKVALREGTAPQTVTIDKVIANNNNSKESSGSSSAKATKATVTAITTTTTLPSTTATTTTTASKVVVNGGGGGGVERRRAGKASQPAAQHGSATTMVFNFADKNEKPSHIRDDGGAPSPMKFKHNDSGIVFISTSGESSDDSRFVEDEDDVRASDPEFIRRPPSPCNVSFVNANIVINGKSSIQRKPKSKKYNISFSEELTLLFEYPSEASLLEDDTPASTGGLASYTPSKLQLATSFELGVSEVLPRTAPSSISPQAPSSAPLAAAEEPEECLRPAEDGTVFSAEFSSDMLF